MASMIHALGVAIIVLVLHSLQASSRTLDSKLSMEEMHEQWMARWGRVYRDAVEKEHRFKIFKDNVGFIQSFNDAGKKQYKLGINAFADMTNEEFRASQNGFKPSKTRPSVTTSFKYENVTSVPPSVDWRKKRAVTPVKEQGSCGANWAFSAVAATEGIYALTTHKLVSLSVQELIDCEDLGCTGGTIDDAFEFIKEHGLTTEANYPYTGKQSSCNTQKEASYVAKIKGYEEVPADNEEALLKAVANQPVAVAIDASGFDFQFYASGVFTGKCGTVLDHGAAVVGYGTSSGGIKYWLLKNSWGTAWGEGGYIRLQRDVEAKEGLCGIAMEASYPVM